MSAEDDKSEKKVLLSIPVYNEQNYINAVLDEVGRYISDILVIDDGSTDDSKRLLAQHQNISLITHPRNLGYGQTIIDAFHFAQSHSYDWLITMDCDFQHQPSWIPALLAVIDDDEADIISGSRYMPGSARHSIPPPDRRRINKIITERLNVKLHLELTDAFCGFKAYRVEALARLKLSETGYAFPLEFWVQVAQRRLRLGEIPVGLIYNDHNRYFGGQLDDSEVRLRHYKEVLEAALLRAGFGGLYDQENALKDAATCPTTIISLSKADPLKTSERNLPKNI
ncbi:glycosyltransferase family 2 protein [Planctomycetota bacterium]